MLLDDAHLSADLVDLFRDALQVPVVLFDRIEPTVDLCQAGVDRMELLVDNLFDDRAHVVLGREPLYLLLDEIDGFQNVLGVLVHRTPVYHAVCNAHVEYKVRTVHMMARSSPVADERANLTQRRSPRTKRKSY